MSNIIILEEIMQEKNHLLSVEETLKLYETDKKAGLNSQEIKERQEKYGLNQLEEAKKATAHFEVIGSVQRFYDYYFTNCCPYFDFCCTRIIKWTTHYRDCYFKCRVICNSGS